MKNLFLLVSLLVLNLNLKAQFVIIPDPNFVTFLQQNYPNCMNGNQMDTTCSEIVNEDIIDLSSLQISNLTGIEFFDNLIWLKCSYNNLVTLPSLPNLLAILECRNNQLTSLPTLPPSLLSLECPFNQLTSLPTLPNSITVFSCGWNQLSSLPTLPNSLTTFNCGNNQLTSLPTLPSLLNVLECFGNQLTNLPVLPNSITELNCLNNQLTSLPNIPNSLIMLNCSDNQIVSISSLPASLMSLNCAMNQLTSISNLPNSITDFHCEFNQLTSLPNIPIELSFLYCDNNLLNSLPTIPNSITTIYCQNNELTNLPNLPTSLIYLNCDSNHLTNLPLLPESLSSLSCYNNNITCFPIFPNTIQYIDIFNNPLSCLPNYVSAMNSVTLAYPLCQENGENSNPNGCNSSKGILGNIYGDLDNDCFYTSSNAGINNIKVKLYDGSGALLKQNFSASNGIYQFSESSGNYLVKIDTTNIPYNIVCDYPGLDSLVNLPNDTLIENVNFPLICKPGFDIGTKSIVTSGWVFPGQNHDIKIVSGDLSQFYNMNCAAGTSGQVQISISGPVTFETNVAGTLTPTVNGNTFTYDISDFGTIDIFNSFGLIFQTDTTAQAGDQICVNVSVTPELGDNNPSNNSFEFCYSVVNSYDPNMKEVYPVNVEPGFDDYFTYTIHFQNTGNAPAMNIRLLDTLDANLDLETFQIINYSHYQTANVRNNILTFHFPNIQLPDSTSNPDGSKGYVQYRIKPKTNLALGTKIHNTANIYFDFNEPIVTNTTINEYVIFENSLSENTKSKVKIYPNPFSSSTTIKFDKTMQNVNLILYNIYGQQVKHELNFSGDKYVLQKENLPAGTYILDVQGKDLNQKVKLVVGE